MRGDEQEPDRRWGTFGTSGQATTKSSIPKGTGFINPASRHRREYDVARETSWESVEGAGHGN